MSEVEEKIYRKARKRHNCVNFGLKQRATNDEVNAHCLGKIEIGDTYREGEMDPYYAGGFGKDRVCMGCDKNNLA